MASENGRPLRLALNQCGRGSEPVMVVSSARSFETVSIDGEPFVPGSNTEASAGRRQPANRLVDPGLPAGCGGCYPLAFETSSGGTIGKKPSSCRIARVVTGGRVDIRACQGIAWGDPIYT